MTADEQQPEDIVAVVGAVDLLGDSRFGVPEVGQQVFGRQRLLLGLTPDGIDGAVAADEDQPRRGIARRAVLRPVLQRAQTGLLEGFFRRVEIAEIAQQGTHRLRARGCQRGIDPGRVGHWEPDPGLNKAIGRIS